MLNFDENRVRTEHQNGVNLIPEVEKIVDKVCEDGYSNIFLFGIGGTLLYAGQIMHTAKQLGCDLPIYLENATDFLYEGNAKFNEKSIVVIASLSGNTIEIEAAIDKAHEVGAKVMGYVEVLNSPLAKKVDYLVNTFGGEYYWWYSVVLRFMKNAGQFDKYDQLMNDQAILNPYIFSLLDYLKLHNYKIALASSSSQQLIHYALTTSKSCSIYR